MAQTAFLWRAWLALYILPWWLTALRSHVEDRADIKLNT